MGGHPGCQLLGSPHCTDVWFCSATWGWGGSSHGAGFLSNAAEHLGWPCLTYQYWLESGPGKGLSTDQHVSFLNPILGPYLCWPNVQFTYRGIWAIYDLEGSTWLLARVLWLQGLSLLDLYWSFYVKSQKTEHSLKDQQLPTALPGWWHQEFPHQMSHC